MHRACCWGTGPQRRRPTVSEVIACRGSATSAASSLRGLVPATLPHHLRSDCLHAPPPLGSPLAKPPAPLQPRALRPQPTARIIISALHRLIAQLAADARSVPLRPSEVSCVILPRLGASDAAPSSPIQFSARTTASRLAPRRTRTTSYIPAPNRPQPTARIIISASPAFASTRSQHKLSRCTQRTTEAQRRQLRHPEETRCQQRCPIISDPIACTHHRPSARPSQNPTHPLQPRAQLPQPTAPNIIHAQPAFATTRSQRSCPPMHAAYHRGPATSAASSVRDSVPATLPQHLPSH
jgi:hypothetical protein